MKKLVWMKKKRSKEEERLRKLVYHDPRWQEIRQRRIHAAKGLCERCFSKGEYRSGEDVHHTIPWMSGKDDEEKQALGLDYDNTEFVCKKCHKILHMILRDPYLDGLI